MSYVGDAHTAATHTAADATATATATATQHTQLTAQGALLDDDIVVEQEEEIAPRRTRSLGDDVDEADRHVVAVEPCRRAERRAELAEEPRQVREGRLGAVIDQVEPG